MIVAASPSGALPDQGGFRVARPHGFRLCTRIIPPTMRLASNPSDGQQLLEPTGALAQLGNRGPPAAAAIVQ